MLWCKCISFQLFHQTLYAFRCSHAPVASRNCCSLPPFLFYCLTYGLLLKKCVSCRSHRSSSLKSRKRFLAKTTPKAFDAFNCSCYSFFYSCQENDWNWLHCCFRKHSTLRPSSLQKKVFRDRALYFESLLSSRNCHETMIGMYEIRLILRQWMLSQPFSAFP